MNIKRHPIVEYCVQSIIGIENCREDHSNEYSNAMDSTEEIATYGKKNFPANINYFFNNFEKYHLAKPPVHNEFLKMKKKWDSDKKNIVSEVGILSLIEKSLKP